MADTEERSWRDASDDGGATEGPSQQTTEPGDETQQLDTQRDERAPETRRTPFTQQVGRVIMAVAAVLFGVFAVANVDSVPFNWIFGESDVPLILLLIVAFAFGALIAWLATMRSSRSY